MKTTADNKGTDLTVDAAGPDEKVRKKLIRQGELIALTAIVVLGGAARVFYLVNLRHEPDFDAPQCDAAFHDYWARGLATGTWSTPVHHGDLGIQSMPYSRPPGYPYFLALIYRLSGSGYLAARIFQMIMGLANCFLAYLLGRALFGRAVGLVLAALMSLYWVFIYFEGELLAPVLVVFLGLALMNVLGFWPTKFTLTRGLAGGILLGLLGAVRANVLLFAPVVLMWAWWIARRRHDGRSVGKIALGFGLGIMGVIGPITIRNYVVAKDFVLISSNTGINLYIGNNPHTDCMTPTVPDLREIAGLDEWTFLDWPRLVDGLSARTGTERTDSEVSAYFTKRAVSYMRSHPGDCLRLATIKAAIFWGPAEVSNNREIGCAKVSSSMFRHQPSFALVVALGVVGLLNFFIAGKERREHGQSMGVDARRGDEVTILIMLFILVYFASFLPFFVNSRFRIPVIPFVFLLGAYGVCRIAGKIAKGDYWQSGAWIAIGIAVYLHAGSQPKWSQPDWERWYTMRGRSWEAKKRYEEAAAEYRKAIEADPERYRGHSLLASLLVEKGEIEEAYSHYRQALANNPSYLAAKKGVAETLFLQGRLAEALTQWGEVLRFRPDDPTIHTDMASALYLLGHVGEALKHWRFALELMPEIPSVRENIELALAQRAQRERLLADYKRIAKAEPGNYDVRRNLAWLLATANDVAFQDPSEAVRLAEQACELSGCGEPAVLDALGVAYAAAGRYADAVAAVEKGIALAQAAEQDELVKEMRGRLELYESGQAYRDQ